MKSHGIALFVTLGLSVGTALAGVKTGTLDVYWADVEGGAGTLIVTPAGESILIDSGNAGVRDPNRLAKLAKEQAGLSKIDFLVTTHMHTDHFGGAAELSELIPIGTVLDNGIPDENPDGNKADRTWLHTIKPYRDMKVAARRKLEPGEVFPLKHRDGAPHLEIRCIGTRQKFSGPALASVATIDCATAKKQDVDNSDNANSVVLVLTFGSFRFFAGGDLTWNIEEKLVCPANLVGQVDVYQANHHGLDVSNNPLLVRTLSPTVAVFSNGTTKGCGANSFQTIKATPSVKAIYQIHKNLRPDAENNTSNEYIANLAQKCEGGWIELAVQPDAKTYTFSIPGNKHSRTFSTR